MIDPFVLHAVVLGLLVWIGIGLSILCGLMWRLAMRAEPRSPRAWEVVDLSAPRGAVEGAETGGRRLVRERVETVMEAAPWDGEDRGYQPSVSFPEMWAYEWPDPEPKPAPLPDEEEA
jgi:hypothetical protein